MSEPNPWVIEAPVAGYHWKAKNPKAQLLLQHGVAEYSERYVTQYSQLSTFAPVPLKTTNVSAC